jgi:hypothetical protein
MLNTCFSYKLGKDIPYCLAGFHSNRAYCHGANSKFVMSDCICQFSHHEPKLKKYFTENVAISMQNVTITIMPAAAAATTMTINKLACKKCA